MIKNAKKHATSKEATQNIVWVTAYELIKELGSAGMVSVTEIMHGCDLSRTCVLEHVKELVRTKWLTPEKGSKGVTYYRLADRSKEG